MKISFRLDDQYHVLKLDGEPWQASDSLVADHLNALEAAFDQTREGTYRPYLSWLLVEYLIQNGWPIRDLKVTELPRFQESPVY